jgi:hypothetical protein
LGASGIRVGDKDLVTTLEQAYEEFGEGSGRGDG